MKKRESQLSSIVAFQPVTFLIVSSLAVLLLPALLIPLWTNKVHKIQNEAKDTIYHVNQGLLSRIQESAKLLSHLNQSTVNLQTIIRSSSVANHSDTPFSIIESEVAPKLFEAMSTIPHVSQISYITSGGLYFSLYTKENNQPFTVYSNNSIRLFLNTTTNYTFYTQPVYQDSGKLYGNAMNISVSSINITSCFKEAMKNSKKVHSSIGTGFDHNNNNTNNQDLVLVNTIAVDEDRVLSVGFEMRPLIGFLTTGFSAFDGSLYLVLEDGTMMLSSGIQNIRVVPSGKGGLYWLMNSYGDLFGEISCRGSENIIEVEGKKLMFYCSKLDFVGLQTVYVLAMPYKRLDTFIEQNIKSASTYLIITLAAMVIAILALTFLTIGCFMREMHLCAALIKQMEATKQAERKSMYKSTALSNASHDIRTSLTGILGLLEITHADVDPRSEIKMNLKQAERCANDLLGILNTILDASKIESGKMQLDKREFDLEQLLEDTVDLFHPIAMKKGVDVLLEPYDFIFRKCSRVKGDSMKLKQILSNLLSNAVKFTYEGHISVKVITQKPSFYPNVIKLQAPKWNKKKSAKWWASCFFMPSDGSYSDFEVTNNFEYDEDIMEFIFEVNDTGKGIPKEKYGSVFENFIQVKDNVPGHEGTGLGLGIVQSLVRLMGGEIAIVEKEIGEKGTCFRFNTFLSVCENAREEDNDSHSLQNSRFHTPKPAGSSSSHVVLFVSSNARSKMLQTHIESYGVKVHVVKHHVQLPQTLKAIKTLLITSNSSNKVLDLSSSNARSPDESIRQTPTRRKIKPSTLTTRASVLIVIDTSAGPFREISRAVAEFRKDLTHALIRVAWIDRPGDHTSLSVQGLDADKLPVTDMIFSKPLHGSRLNQLIGLLVPEFESTKSTTQESRPAESRDHPVLTQNVGRNNGENGNRGDDKPLMGKKILIVEDNAVLRKLAMAVVSRSGAEIFTCENGEEALELVCKHMNELRKQGRMHQSLPFDYILMDCQMPIMDGCDASKRIREKEKEWNLHIPIIALTAHDTDEERNKTIEAGMDYYISKPLKADNFMEAVSRLNPKRC